MKEEKKTNDQLIKELKKLRLHVAKLEQTETKHKQAEEALQETEELFRTIFENSVIGMYRTTPDGRILMANPALVRMLGYPSFKELAKRNLEEKGFDLGHPRSVFKQRIENKGQVIGLESVWTKRDATTLFVRESATAIRDNAGNIIYYEGTVEDITEKKQMEEELKASEKKYKTLIKNINVGIYRNTPGPKGKFIEANPAIIRMFGYSNREEFLKINVSDLYQNPKDRDKLNQKLLKDGFVKNEELKLKKKDKRLFYGEVTAVAVKDKKGEIKYYDGIIKDITEYKNVERNLRESEEKHRTIFENVSDTIIYLNKYGTIIGANNNEATFGYTPEDIIGKNYMKFGFFKTKDIPKMLKIFKDVIKSSKTIELMELEVKHKDGHIIPIEVSTRLIKKNGKTEGFVCLIRDITEHKQAEKSLKDSEKRYRTTFEHTGTAMAIVEEDSTISLVNSQFEKQSKYPKEEIEGKKRWTEFVHEKDLKRMKRYHYNRRKKGKKAPSQYEFRFIDKNKNIKNIFLTVEVIPGTKKSITSLMDITERKMAEEQIRASLREKEVLLREIHHRVKNNMQIISFLLNLQSRSIIDEKVLDMFQGSRDRIRSMALVHEKLYQSKNLSRIDFGQYIQSMTVYLLQSYKVNPNVVKLRINVRDISLDINTAIPCGLIINELVSNSLKHAFPGGKEGEVYINLYSDKDNKYTLMVSDNGVGFPKDLDYRKTDSFGIQLVNMLIEQLNGSINLERRVGTKFTIEFGELEYNKKNFI